MPNDFMKKYETVVARCYTNADKADTQHKESALKYLPPFEILKSYLTISNVKGELMVSCSYENLVQMLRQVIIGVEVDERWYLERYPDIADAIPSSSGRRTGARSRQCFIRSRPS